MVMLVRSPAGLRKKKEKKKRPIVVKRVSRVLQRGRATGSWKIAYADFVTALMAFFLLMWLVDTNNSERLRDISNYFKMPLAVALAGGPAPGDASSVIQGGGRSLTAGEGKVHLNPDIPPRADDVASAGARVRQDELERLRRLKQRLEDVVDLTPQMQKFRDQLLIDFTSDGLRIQIVDKQSRPMFDLGSATPEPYAEDILKQIGRVLNEVPNHLSIAGHTDARPYQGVQANYSNWELSIDRANASRRELISGGMDPAKIDRVVGLSSSVPLDDKNPLNPNNRRISIIVMNAVARNAAAATPQ
ncbi:MAG: flagellar motor protein MotB [Betaproteobacteria bacterium]|nr:flagellar motor protein MotB [Betaproteobacteria bacterium]